MVPVRGCDAHFVLPLLKSSELWSSTLSALALSGPGFVGSVVALLAGERLSAKPVCYARDAFSAPYGEREKPQTGRGDTRKNGRRSSALKTNGNRAAISSTPSTFLFCVIAQHLLPVSPGFCIVRTNEFYSRTQPPSTNRTAKGGTVVPEKWTGRLVGKMHNECVTMQQMADEMGVTKAYVSMILNSKKKPARAQERLEAAFAAVVASREVTASAAEN